jgi:hypothetical protein
VCSAVCPPPPPPWHGLGAPGSISSAARDGLTLLPFRLAPSAGPFSLRPAHCPCALLRRALCSACLPFFFGTFSFAFTLTDLFGCRGEKKNTKKNKRRKNKWKNKKYIIILLASLTASLADLPGASCGNPPSCCERAQGTRAQQAGTQWLPVGARCQFPLNRMSVETELQKGNWNAPIPHAKRQGLTSFQRRPGRGPPGVTFEHGLRQSQAVRWLCRQLATMHRTRVLRDPDALHSRCTRQVQSSLPRSRPISSPRLLLHGAPSIIRLRVDVRIRNMDRYVDAVRYVAAWWRRRGVHSQWQDGDSGLHI